MLPLTACSFDGVTPAAAAPPAGRLSVPPRNALADGFVLEPVAQLESPTAIAFTPDGRMLTATQPGRLYITAGGTSSPALDLTGQTCTNIEQGMLGVAVDPNFEQNGWIYVFYTANRQGVCGNRVSRFALGDRPVAGGEQVLIDLIPSPKGNHNAGDLNFGPDGFLYVSTGDGGCDYAGGACDGYNSASRDRHVLLGKILRITADGAIPPGNPFTGPGSDRCNLTGMTAEGRTCQETFAWGLRNPYRFTFDPNHPGRFFINDVGQDRWEEINEGIAGADYGWNVREGHCAMGRTTDCANPPAGTTEPIFDYAVHRKGGCHAITGGAFVPEGLWPAPYSGSYLFGDFGCGAIFRLVEDAGGKRSAVAFASGFTKFGIVHLEFGPSEGTQALYFTTYENGGAVYRIRYIGPA